MYDAVEKVLIDEQSIIERCKELGAQITNDYAQKNETPYVVGLLRGSVPFMAELIKHIKLDIQIDFMDVSSYSGTKSLGDIRINKDLECPIQGLSVLLVEDIIDTGRTLTEVIRTLKNKGAKEVKVVSLVEAIVSILTLQNTLIAVNATPEEASDLKILTIVSSIVGLLAILYFIVDMFIKFVNKIKKSKKI